MGAGVCCGEDRKILTVEKRRMLEGRPDDSFKFTVDDVNPEADTEDSTRSSAKKRKKSVRFVEGDPERNLEFDLDEKEGEFISI